MAILRNGVRRPGFARRDRESLKPHHHSERTDEYFDSAGESPERSGDRPGRQLPGGSCYWTMKTPVSGAVVALGCVTKTPPVLSDVNPLMDVGATKLVVVPGALAAKVSFRLQSVPTV
jgi:hypothetical protein